VNAWKRAIVRVWHGIPNKNARYCGTAFLIAPNYLVTAKHVVKDLPYNEVFIQGLAWDEGGSYGIKLPIYHDSLDIAILELKKAATTTNYIPLATIKTVDIHQGSLVTLAGYSTEYASIETPIVPISGYDGVYNLVIAHTSIAKGMSGGPALVNGELVGLICARNQDGTKTYLLGLNTFLDFIAPYARYPSSDTSREERFLDAAIPEQVVVGEQTELITMIRLPNSEGLRKILQDVKLFQSNIQDIHTSDAFDIYFPVNEQGNITELDLLIKIETSDFEILQKQDIVKVYPTKDSAHCVFLLTPQKRGKLTIVIKIYLINSLIASAFMKLYGRTKLEGRISALRMLMTFPIGIFSIDTTQEGKSQQSIDAAHQESLKYTNQETIELLIKQLEDNDKWLEAAEALIAIGERVIIRLETARKSGNWLLKKRIDWLINEIQAVSESTKQDSSV